MKKSAAPDSLSQYGQDRRLERNFNSTVFEKLEKFLKEYPDVLKEFENLFNGNLNCMDRTIGTGCISAESALNY
jgi:NADH-quinone oxidoreductase subunit D